MVIIFEWVRLPYHNAILILIVFLESSLRKCHIIIIINKDSTLLSISFFSLWVCFTPAWPFGRVQTWYVSCTEKRITVLGQEVGHSVFFLAYRVSLNVLLGWTRTISSVALYKNLFSHSGILMNNRCLNAAEPTIWPIWEDHHYGHMQ